MSDADADADADVVVLGGGPGGAATALALARAGTAVTLVDRGRDDRVRTGEERAGEVLPPAVRLPLTGLGLWDRFRAGRCAPAPGMVAAWGRPEPATRDFILDPYGPGWHVDRRDLDRMLVHAAADAGVRVHRGVRTAVSRADGAWRVAMVDTATGGRTLRTPFLVDATGRASWLTRRLGVDRVRHDRLVGIVGRVALPRSAADRRAVVEAGPHGWWYSAPLPGGRLVVADMTDADRVAGAAGRPEQVWWRDLASAPLTRDRVGSATDVDVRVHPAATVAPRRVAGAGWLAVGDAAAALDPLAGAGVLGALESGLAAARALATTGRDRVDAVERYAADVERRFRDQLRQRAGWYRTERRWPDSPFWMRRHRAGDRHDAEETRSTDAPART